MKVRIAQLVVTKNQEENEGKIINVISDSQQGEWVIFPEGMLSGYYPEDETYLSNLDWPQLEESIFCIPLPLNLFFLD